MSKDATPAIDAIENELRRSPPSALLEFQEWCIHRRGELQSGAATSETQSQTRAILGALQEIQHLKLVGDDALAKRLAELRDEIGLAE